ncbi:Anthranilate synthase alpha subunit 1, chloroplastic [Linum perenne]
MEAAKQGKNLVPLQYQIFSDQLTPVTAYRCLVKEHDTQSPSFLFEPVESSAHSLSTVGRYSVVGAYPSVEIVAKDKRVTIMDHERGTLTEDYAQDPMVIPRNISRAWKPLLISDLPPVFCGGWFGFFSYDMMRYAENVKLPFSSAPRDDLNLPDMHLGLYDDVLIIDHVQKTVIVIDIIDHVMLLQILFQKVYVIHWVHIDRYTSVQSAYVDGMKRLETLVARVHDIDPPKLSVGFVNGQTHTTGPLLEKSSKTVSQFADPFEVYRALGVVNPSPYMAYLQARGCISVSSSPEIFTQVKQKKVVNRLLAGSITRGKSAEDDEILAKQLLNDRKQCARHIILADSTNNNVGKVEVSRNVKVEKLMEIERLHNVMHISTTVTGELKNNLTVWDALQAALTIGTEARAMELIYDLEMKKQGSYSGGFGWVSFLGDMDMSQALRTMVFPTDTRQDTMYSYQDVEKRCQWVAYLQASSGIVVDNIPQDEQVMYQIKAIALAETAFLQNHKKQGGKRGRGMLGSFTV